MKFMILGWEKYNPRADYKSMPWFRMDSMLPTDRKLFGLTVSERWVWVVLLCVAARENKGGVFSADLSWLADHAKVEEHVVTESLAKFQDRGMIDIATDAKRTRRKRQPNDGARDMFATDERNETDETNETEGGGSRLSPAGLQNLWNEHRGVCRKCEVLSSGREKNARARLAEKGDPEFWVGIIKRIAANPFCRGVNDRGWKANFEFLCRPDTYARVLEGEFDSAKKVAANPFEGQVSLTEQLRRDKEASGG